MALDPASGCQPALGANDLSRRLSNGMFFIPKLRRRRYADRRAWRSIEISTDYRRRLPYLPVRQHCEPGRRRIARAWSAYSFFHSSFSGIGGAQARTQALAPDQDADQRQMPQVEEDAGGEGDGIKPA